MNPAGVLLVLVGILMLAVGVFGSQERVWAALTSSPAQGPRPFTPEPPVIR